MRERSLCALIAVSTLAIPHVAAWPHDPTEGLRACSAEPDDARRLACYDREIKRLPAPDSVDDANPAPAATPVLSPEETFGLNETQVRKKQNGEEAPTLKRLTARITKVAQRPHGELVMTLDNGQVWVQKHPGAFDVRVGDTITIKVAALGSFMMSTAAGRSTRVSRVL